MSSFESFESSPLVRADLARFEERCLTDPTRGAAVRALQASYSPPARSLILDASSNRHGFGNGVGNIYGDYLMWISLALQS